jgi:hypothetical protein
MRVGSHADSLAPNKAHSEQTAASAVTAKKLKEKASLHEGHGFSRAVTNIKEDGFSHWVRFCAATKAARGFL